MSRTQGLYRDGHKGNTIAENTKSGLSCSLVHEEIPKELLSASPGWVSRGVEHTPAGDYSITTGRDGHKE
jgi:hypothetical protein